MAVKSGFFNSTITTAEDGSTIYDREYYAADFANYLSKVVSNGVFATPSDNLQVVTDNSMKVIIKAGEGRINGYWVVNETDFTYDVPSADVILNRIDRITMQLDLNQRKIAIVYKTGELSTNPVAPELERSESIQEYSLARIRVNKGTTVITQSMITDTRPLEDECGLIATMGKMESKNYFIQMQEYVDQFIAEQGSEFTTWEEAQKAVFNTWFESIKNEIQATNLYREYSAIYYSSTIGESVINIPTEVRYTKDNYNILNVYINGIKLIENTEYTIDEEGTQITLANSLNVVGTAVEFINKKCVDESGAESIVDQVDTLRTDVNNLMNVELGYVCNGTNDNVVISNKVKNFIQGIGEYSGVADNAQLKIVVNGVVGISELIEGQSIFGFSTEMPAHRRVFVDFANATIPAINIADYTYPTNIFAVFNLERVVTVMNANICIYGTNPSDNSLASMYIVHGGYVENCYIYNTVENHLTANNVTKYLMYACNKASNNKIELFDFGNMPIDGLFYVMDAYYNSINLIAPEGSACITGNGVYIGNRYKGGNINLTEAKANVGNVNALD